VAKRVRGAAEAVRARWSATLLIVAVGALIAGLVGATAGQWAGWRTAGPLPADGDAAAIARLALGGPAPAAERRDDLFGSTPDGYGPGYVRFTVPADLRAAAFEWQAKDVRVRLRTAGWRVDQAWRGPSSRGRQAGAPAPVEPPDGLIFVADKGDLRVRYSAAGTDAVHLDVVRAQPMAVLPAGALGGLLGAGLGWLATSWAVRRWRRLDGGRRFAAVSRRAVAASAGLGAVALLPALIVTGVQQIIGYVELARPQIPLWTAVTQPVVGVLAALAALSMVAAALLLVASRSAEVNEG
jgi:hypothetical protein